MAYRHKRRKLTIQVSSNLIDDLPDNLLCEILDQLPSKYVVQCKAVCKRWLRIISDPYFVKWSIDNHHHHEQLNFLFQYYELHSQGNCSKHLQSISSLPHLNIPDGNQPHMLSFVPCFKARDPRPISVVSYFKDLLVCCKSDLFQNTYYICNPLTKQSFALPPARPECYKDVKVGLICYPSKQASITSIPYNYKLVRTPEFKGLKRFEAEVFCSKSGKWSKSMVSSPRGLSSLLWFQDFVAYNGILHWLNVNPSIRENCPFKNLNCSIVAYDPLNNVERCRIMDPPTDAKPIDPIGCLGVCRGNLRISQLNGLSNLLYEDVLSLSVWELEDYNVGKWRLEHKFYLKDLVSEDVGVMEELEGAPRPFNKVLAFHPLDADIVYIDCRGRLLSCNMRTRTLVVVGRLGHESRALSDIILRGNFYPTTHPWWPTPIPS